MGSSWQGCALHPPKQQQQPKQQHKLVSCGMAGWVRWRGTLQVRPCKLGRRIHAAHAPATGPTPPSTDSRGLLERLLGSDPLSEGNGSDPRCISISDRFHPRMAWINVSTKVDTYQQQRRSVRGGAVSECGVSAAWMPRPSLHGRTCGVPALRHRPTNSRKARCCCCCCCCCCRPAAGTTAGAGLQALPTNLPSRQVGHQ